MIDNLELIKPLLNFENKGDFYMLYVFKRKKDFPELEQKNHQSVRTIKTYCIDSIDYLDRRIDEIRSLCEHFKARAYIHVQKQNHIDVSLCLMEELAKRIRNGVTNQKSIFDSVVGQLQTHEKRWVVDVDDKDSYLSDFVSSVINDKCNPEGKKVIASIPTKNGIHLITGRFDVMEFQKIMSNKSLTVDIQKKNPTLLYYPNSLECVHS